MSADTNKKFKVFLPLILSLILALGMFLGFKLRDAQGYKAAYFLRPGRLSTVQEIINLIDVKYVDSVNGKSLKDEAINGLLSRLDPHSLYIPPDQLTSVNEDLEGNFEGIGVEFNIFGDTVNITSVISGGPSQASGLQTGDKIIRVDDSLVAGNHITAERIKKILRGPKGSEVKVTVLRNSQLMPFSIKRDVIPLHSVDASYMLSKDIGYIKINRFAGNTYGEFMEAMLKLQKEGLKKLVIDLRQNPGGYLDAATNIADELLDSNKLILYTQGKSYPRTNYNCQKPGVFEQGPLVILVDEGSASASEILSGAVQDWDRGTIIGRRTFGKGLVQEQFGLNDGGALRLTVARYYIPSGRCIQKSYSNGIEAYDEDILNRYHDGELVSADSIHFQDTTQYYTKLKHRVVHGGGGIVPDIFVPLDTTALDPLMNALYMNNTLYDFAYEYYSHHQDDFKQYHSSAEFNERFSFTSAMLESFRQYALKDSTVRAAQITSQDEQEIARRLKALLARQVWNTEGYYQVSNSTDPMVEKAISVLDK